MASPFGVMADDAAAAVPFKEGHLKLLLQPALAVDSIDLLHRMLHRILHRMFCGLLLSGLLGVPSAGSWAGGFRSRFRGHVWLSFVGSRAAGRGRGLVR